MSHKHTSDIMMWAHKPLPQEGPHVLAEERGSGAKPRPSANNRKKWQPPPLQKNAGGQLYWEIPPDGSPSGRVWPKGSAPTPIHQIRPASTQAMLLWRPTPPEQRCTTAARNVA
jgi:hypothetical protein